MYIICVKRRPDFYCDLHVPFQAFDFIEMCIICIKKQNFLVWSI